MRCWYAKHGLGVLVVGIVLFIGFGVGAALSAAPSASAAASLPTRYAMLEQATHMAVKWANEIDPDISVWISCQRQGRRSVVCSMRYEDPDWCIDKACTQLGILDTVKLRWLDSYVVLTSHEYLGLMIERVKGMRGADRSRTGMHGFAGRCVAIPPRRLDD